MKTAEIDEEPWYAAKSIFFHRDTNLFEERVVIFKAESFDQAWEKSELEVQRYISELKDIDVAIEFIKTVEIFHIFDKRLTDGSEVFSSMRRSAMAPNEFVADKYELGLDWE